MRTALKFTLGLLSVAAITGCGAASQTEGQEQGTVATQSEALTVTYADLAKGIKQDFNGDLIEDIIAVYSSTNPTPGSYERLGTLGGGFQPSTWTRTDLTMGNVSYTVGDFDGDHRSDLIIMTAGGSYEYLGVGGGGFTPDVWIRNDLPLGNLDYTVGDYNGDGKSDLLIGTSSGVYEYLGKAGGGFDSVWWHPIARPNVKLTAGDFDGDGISDVIFTADTASYLYTGLAAGGFTPNVWSSSAYPLNGCRFFTGDFNGDGKVDVIAQNSTDAREFLGAASGGFAATTWIHPEYSLNNNVNFVPGDYDGDRAGKWDLILADGTGSHELVGQSGSGFILSGWWSKSDADSYHTGFKRGDFSGDGKDDILISENLPPGTPGTKEYKGQTLGFSASAWSDPNLVVSDGVIF